MNNSPKNQDKKTRLFISYSRQDKTRVEALHNALSGDDELEVYLDTHDIEAGVEWKSRLEDFIRSADSILFFISPNSASSEICQWEMELAGQLNKRIVPVVIKDVANETIPDAVTKLNYVFCRKKAEFEPALVSIGQALEIDIDWIREHTRIADLAYRWEQTRNLGAQPLRGKDLEAAERWLANQPKEAPSPTEIQRRYIYESRRAATKRQRLTVTGSIAAVLIVGVLAIFAWVQRNAAIESEILAIENEKIALIEKKKAKDALDQATLTANKIVFGISDRFSRRNLSSEFHIELLEKAIDLQSTLNDMTENYSKEVLNSQSATLLKLLRIFSDNNQQFSKYESVFNDVSKKLENIDEKESLWIRRRAVYLMLLAGRFSDIGDAKKAEEYYLASLAKIRSSIEYDADDPRWMGDASLISASASAFFASIDARSDALTHSESAIQFAKLAIGINDSNTYQSYLSSAYDQHAKSLLLFGKTDEATKYLEYSVEASRIANTDGSNDVISLNSYAVSLANLGTQLLIQGNNRKSEKYFTKALEKYTMLSDITGSLHHIYNRASVASKLGSNQSELGMTEKSIESFSTMDEALRPLARYETSPNKLVGFATFYRVAGNDLSQLGEMTHAQTHYQSELKIRERIHLFDPSFENARQINLTHYNSYEKLSPTKNMCDHAIAYLKLVISTLKTDTNYDSDTARNDVEFVLSLIEKFNPTKIDLLSKQCPISKKLAIANLLDVSENMKGMQKIRNFFGALGKH